MKSSYRKKREKEEPKEGIDLKLSAMFFLLIIGAMVMCYYEFNGRKSVTEKLKESKIMLMQMDSSLEVEHKQLEVEHQQWIKEHRQAETTDTINKLQHKKLEEQHTEMIRKHREMMVRHKKLLEDFDLVDRRYQNKEMEDLSIQEQNKNILNDYE